MLCVLIKKSFPTPRHKTFFCLPLFPSILMIPSTVFPSFSLLVCVCVCVCVCVFPIAQSRPTLCDPMDCSSPGSSVHVVFQARILGCPRNLPNPRMNPCRLCFLYWQAEFFTIVLPGKPFSFLTFFVSIKFISLPLFLLTFYLHFILLGFTWRIMSFIFGLDQYNTVITFIIYIVKS